jgi:hypothetical protein
MMHERVSCGIGIFLTLMAWITRISVKWNCRRRTFLWCGKLAMVVNDS